MKPSKRMSLLGAEDLSIYTYEELLDCIMRWESIDLRVLTGILAEIKKREILKEREPLK